MKDTEDSRVGGGGLGGGGVGVGWGKRSGQHHPRHPVFFENSQRSFIQVKSRMGQRAGAWVFEASGKDTGAWLGLSFQEENKQSAE